MDGRLVIEDGTILDLLEMVVGSNRWEAGGSGRKAMNRGRTRRFLRMLKRNVPNRARKNVAHHYDLSDELYEALTLIQTGKVRSFPVALMGTDYWRPLMDQLRLMATEKTIDTRDLEPLQ